MRILVTGGDGLLARTLLDAAPTGIEVSLFGHGQFDLTQVDLMDRQLASFRPQIVINTDFFCELGYVRAWLQRLIFRFQAARASRYSPQCATIRSAAFPSP